MQHGDWPGSEAEPVIEGDRLVALDFRWDPVEEGNNGFEMIGTLTRMFSRYFAEMTIKDEAVVQVRAPTRPGWFAPLLSPGYKSDVLPLWRFTLMPKVPGSRPLEIDLPEE